MIEAQVYSVVAENNIERLFVVNIYIHTSGYVFNAININC